MTRRPDSTTPDPGAASNGPSPFPPPGRPMVDSALWYARRGWRVVPIFPIRDGVCACRNRNCTSAGKHPIGWLAQRGLKDASNDPEVIREWYTGQWADANIALATGKESNLVVIDLDLDDSGGMGALAEAYNPGAVVQTGSGGQQKYYAYPDNLPDDVQIRNSASKLAPHVDVRGEDGYVVAPPSVSSKGPYSWLMEPEEDGLPPPPPELRQTLLDAQPKKRNRESAPPPPDLNDAQTEAIILRLLSDALAKAQRGCRRSTGTGLAIQLHAAGVPKEAVREAMLRFGRAVAPLGPNPESDEDWLEILDWAYDQEPGDPPKVAEDIAGQQDEARGEAKANKLMGVADWAIPVRYQTPTGQFWVGLMQKDGSLRHVRLDAPDVARHLRAAYYETYQKVVPTEYVTNVVVTLEGIVARDHVICENYVRVAPWWADPQHADDQPPDRIYYDLGGREAVEIAPGAWRVVAFGDNPPVYFRREGAWAAQVQPTEGLSRRQRLATLAAFHRLLGEVDDDGFVRILGFALATLNPLGPFPLLAVTGEQGGGKSTACVMLGRWLDPQCGRDGQVETAPRGMDDVMTATLARWVLDYDNLSFLNEGLSDLFAGLATGTSHNRRAHYKNDQGHVFHATRAIILNGIEDVATRPDLMDRALPATFRPFAAGRRRQKRAVFRAFEKLRQDLLGVLFDAAAQALARLDLDYQTDARMADAVAWVAAGESVFGWDRGAFEATALRCRDEAAQVALDASLVGNALLHWLRYPHRDAYWDAGDREVVPGRLVYVGALYRRLCNDNRDLTKQPNWPKTAGRFGGKLRRLAPALRASGWKVEFFDSDGKGVRVRITEASEASGSQASAVAA